MNKQYNTMGTNAKVTRSTVNEPDKIFEYLVKLDNKFDQLGSDLKTNLDKQTVNLREEFQKHLMDFDEKLKNSMIVQSEKVLVLESVNENNNRMSRLNDVIIKGVPFTKNEKLFEIFVKISATIKFDQPILMCLNNIFRFKSANQNIPAPILLQFSTQLLKREFMYKYFAHGDLKVSHIGMSSENRIFASDNLTKLNNGLLQKALALVKNKKLHKVRTQAGYVYVQFTNTSESIRITQDSDFNCDADRLDKTLCNDKVA